jgi:hypothetical protein
MGLQCILDQNSSNDARISEAKGEDRTISDFSGHAYFPPYLEIHPSLLRTFLEKAMNRVYKSALSHGGGYLPPEERTRGAIDDPVKKFHRCKCSGISINYLDKYGKLEQSHSVFTC